MKKILILLIVALSSLIVTAQDRVNTGPEQLSYKSQEIRKALYWEKNSSTGKWVSRPSKKAPWMGDGVHADNFTSIFIGEYEGYRYLFLEFLEGGYQYPNLKVNWSYYAKVYQALITDDDYESLKNIEQGSDVITIKSRLYDYMFRSHPEYSFDLLLRMTDISRKIAQREYSRYTEKYDENFAIRMQAKDYPPIEIITAKRTMSDGKDVVRFLVYPHSSKWLIDNFYFEVPYSEFQKLFIADKKTTYK